MTKREQYMSHLPNPDITDGAIHKITVWSSKKNPLKGSFLRMLHHFLFCGKYVSKTEVKYFLPERLIRNLNIIQDEK